MCLNRVSILFLILGPNRFWFHILMKVKYLLSIMHVNIEVPASWLMNVDGSKILCALTMVGRTVVTER